MICVQYNCIITFSSRSFFTAIAQLLHVGLVHLMSSLSSLNGCYPTASALTLAKQNSSSKAFPMKSRKFLTLLLYVYPVTHHFLPSHSIPLSAYGMCVLTKFSQAKHFRDGAKFQIITSRTIEMVTKTKAKQLYVC